MLVLVAAVVGLLCGSFANVLIARVPHGKDWIREPSHCVHCEARIAWYHNVPVVSWLILRGKCRDCKQRISVQYPLVELAVAALFVGVVMVFGISVLSVYLLYLALISVALIVIDIHHRRLPDAIVFPAMAVTTAAVLIHAVVHDAWGDAARAGWGALILGGYYYLLYRLYPKGMGFGDVKTALVLGAALGVLGWAPLAVGAIAGPLLGGIGAVVAIVRARRFANVRIPYGPWLISGAWVGLFAGERIADWYVGWVLQWS